MKFSTPEHMPSEKTATAAEQPTKSARCVEPGTFVCVVGSSAGGLSAMLKLFAHVPHNNMSFVVLQHLPLDHKSELVSILEKKTNLNVEFIQSDTVPRIGTIHIIPADSYLTFSGTRMHLHERTLENKTLATIDHCMKCLAREFKNQAVAVILSGTGSDGTEGLRHVRAHGGYGFAQSPADADYASMPQSAVDKTDIDFCLPAEKIAQKLAQLGTASKDLPAPKMSSICPDQFNILARLVLQRCQIDLRGYKRNTFERRLDKRMRTLGIETISGYIDAFKNSADEANLLMEEIFINVTQFFRDSAVFEHLQSETFRRLIRECQHDEGLRIWSLGCSTGEEAYSLAIALQLAMEQENVEIPIKVIASDIDAKAIAVARKGIYSRDIAADIKPDILHRFFSLKDERLRVDASIRKNILFSNHDVLNDPPFSKIDFISCRNLLIYFRPPAQHRCFDLMHYALRHQGTLLLGNSESIGESADMFMKENRGFNLYRKCLTTRQARMVLPPFKQTAAADSRTPQDAVDIRDIRRDIDAFILKRFSEPGVVVASNLNVLEVRGDVGRYLGLNSGIASFNLLRFAPVGMHRSLEQAVKAVDSGQKEFFSAEVECLIDDQLRLVRLQAMAISRNPQRDSLVLIVFADAETATTETAKEIAPTNNKTAKDISHRYVAALENELHVYKERLEQAIDDREISLEETKYVGQEAQASHEELQSFIEELETSKEEIQSSNEELTVVNQEYKDRMTELEEAREEVQNILQYGDTCLVAINANFCIYRFSASAANLFQLTASLREKSLSYLHRFLVDCDLHDLTHEAINKKQRFIVETKHRDGFELELNIQPLATSAGTEHTGCLLIFSLLGPAIGHASGCDAATLQRRNEKNWLFSSYGVAIVTTDLIGVWGNLEFYRLIQERRENFVSHQLGRYSLQNVFRETFYLALRNFGLSKEKSLSTDKIATFDTTSSHLHVINVEKICGTEGQQDLIRITFEEKRHA